MISRIYTLKIDDTEYTFDLTDVQVVYYARNNNELRISFKSDHHRNIERIIVPNINEYIYLNFINDLKELYNKSQANSNYNYEEFMEAIKREQMIPYHPFENKDK